MSDRELINCEICHSFLHKTKECVSWENIQGLLASERRVGFVQGQQDAWRDIKALILTGHDLEDLIIIADKKLIEVEGRLKELR